MEQIRVAPEALPPPPPALADPSPVALAPLAYRAPTEDPQLGAGGVLKGAIAICLAGLLLLMAAPGVWVLLDELPHQKMDGDKVMGGLAVILLALVALAAAVITARDYLFGRNARRRQRH
jgi:formate hydrogenlyase subunit 3/multisubunit Na+/H+ antiporter MnhD subunit